MTSRERVLAALRHRTPDRTPIFEYVLQPPLADHFLGRSYAPARFDELLAELGYAEALCRCAVDIVELAARLGHDMLYVVPVALPDAPLPEPSGEDPVERLQWRNGWLESHWSPPGDAHYAIYPALREAMARRGVDLPILAPAYRHGVWTDIDLLQTMALEPEVAHRHFALATRAALADIDRYLALGVEQIGVGGDFSGTRPLISPAAYRMFIVPEVRQLTRRIHAGGAFAVNASDGDLWPVIDDFLLGCEADGYLEIDQFAGMDLRRLKAEYGGRVTLYGNMDCGNTLSFAAPDTVRAATLACLEAGLGDGGHIFCASNAITASVPAANYLAMVNGYREFWGMERVNL